MKCFVADSPFDPALISYRAPGFGGPSKKPLIEYSITIGDGEFTPTFKDRYEEFLGYCIDDDKFASESDVPELKELGYPSFEIVFKRHRPLLAYLMRSYLDSYVFEMIFDDTRESGWQFLINNIENVEALPDGFKMSGKGFFV